MKFPARILIAYIVNIAALYIIGTYVPMIAVTQDPRGLALLGVLFTLLNFIIKPILKLVLSPFIVLTLGLALIAVNALLLFVLDILSEGITIQSTFAYLIGALVVGVINVIAHILFHKK